MSWQLGSHGMCKIVTWPAHYFRNKIGAKCNFIRFGFWVEKPFRKIGPCYIRPYFYQTRSAWSMDQGSTKKRSAVHNFVPTVTKFCVMWEGLSFPHDTKFGNCRGETVDRRVIFIWSLIHGSSWSGLIKVGPALCREWKARWLKIRLWIYADPAWPGAQLFVQILVFVWPLIFIWECWKMKFVHFENVCYKVIHHS